MIIDSHCHLHDEKFACDLKAVLDRAKKAGVDKFITIGCDLPTSQRAYDLALKYDNIFFTAGFHPHDAKDLNHQSLAKLKEIAQRDKCVAIGECGLDYYYLHSDKDAQKTAFIKQLELARALSLPVVVHLRDAFDDCVDILSDFRDILTVIHCFSGTLAEAKTFVDLDCFISLSGIVTFKKSGELPLVAREIPLDRLLIETDCPYLSPHPFRGQRNEPAFIGHTLKAVAAARGEDEGLVAKHIYQNSKTFFGL